METVTIIQLEGNEYFSDGGRGEEEGRNSRETGDRCRAGPGQCLQVKEER